MARLKPNELRNLSKDEIDEKLRTFKKEQYGLVYQNQTARTDKPHRLKVLRRSIARCITILGEKENADKKK